MTILNSLLKWATGINLRGPRGTAAWQEAENYKPRECVKDQVKPPPFIMPRHCAVSSRRAPAKRTRCGN